MTSRKLRAPVGPPPSHRLALVAVLTSLLVVPAAAAARDDASVTPAGWRVAPVGQEIGVAKGQPGFQGPLGAALSPDARHLLAASSGAARIDSVDLFNLHAGARTDFVRLDALRPPGQAAFLGVVYSPDGRHAWASGGGENVVHVFDVSGNHLTHASDIPVPNFPAGLAYGRTPHGDRIYVAENLSAPASGALGNPPGGQVAVIDPTANAVVSTIDLGSRLEPIGVAFDRTGRKAFVTNWMGRSVSVLDTASELRVADVQLSPPGDPLQADHPSAVAANPVRHEMYTANSNSDTVSVIDASTNTLRATIDVGLVRGGPKGADPDGLAVSPDGTRLYVAEAGENAVAVVDLDRDAVDGFMPTAWYPADVEVTPDGSKLVITNANASGAGPNPCGPLTPRTDCPRKDPAIDDPGRESKDSQYAGSMIKGSIQVVKVPRRRQLRRLTMKVQRNNVARDRQRKVPRRAAAAIKHVIYVVKENRTFDQVFGDLGRGDGDASLALFREDSAPNHRALARRFTTIDNFYADAEVSADGHNWITQANATDYVDKTWPINYSPRPRSSQRAYDFEDVPYAQQFATEPLAGDPSVTRSAAAQTVGYLWDDAFAHGVSYRDYGEYTQFPGDCSGANQNLSHTTHLDTTKFPGRVDTAFAGYNLACSDHAQREPEWEREFRGFERARNLPALEIVRLPNDHTRGTTPGAATPKAYVADNDLALGRLVDAVSHSRYWKDTVILVTEDDAQNGPDHVDAHRTIALAISPYTQTRRVDHTHYDTSSMVATAEDLLGLPPMSVTDARASRMWHSFTGRPSYARYAARTPRVTPFGAPGAPTNAPSAPMAAASARWNFRDADATPEIGLNRAIWKSIRGRASHPPAPRHRHIVGSRPNDEDGASETRAR